jgi:hypothetical protein
MSAGKTGLPVPGVKPANDHMDVVYYQITQ